MKTILCSADRIIGFFRMAYPAMTKYGRDGGGNTEYILRAISNEKLVEHVADTLWTIDYEFEKATRQHFEAIRVALDAKQKRERDLLAEMPMIPLAPTENSGER